MTCPLCKEKRLWARPTADEDAADDWQAAVLCEICREPIDPERLDAIPGTKRCAACQGKTEAGQLDEIEPRLLPALRCADRSARQPRRRNYSLQTSLHG